MIWQDGSQVVELTVQKFYSLSPKVVVYLTYSHGSDVLEDKLLDSLDKYFVYHKLREKLGCTFDQFVLCGNRDSSFHD